MSLPYVATDLADDQGRKHRTLIAQATNELIKVRPPHDRTVSEASAGVTPIDPRYAPGDVRRYGAIADGSTDSAFALQAAINQCQLSGAAVYIYGARNGFGYRVTSAVSITSAVKIYGDGYANSCIRSPNTNGVFVIAAGVSQVEMSDFRMSCETRHSSTPNAIKAINIQGTPSSRCFAHIYRDLFIDGYGRAIQADCLVDSHFDHILCYFGKDFIFADKFVVNCFVYNCIAAGDGTGQGITMGDGVEASEGWQITNNTLQSFLFTIVGNGCQNNIVSHNQLDFFGTAAVYIISGASMASTNWLVANNYMACGMIGGDSAVICRNNIASSNPRGNRIINNDILVYLFGGFTLSYGIRIDGTQEIHNLVSGNNVACSGGGGFDLKMDTGTLSRVIGNEWRTTGATFASGVNPLYSDNIGPSTGQTPVVASAAALTLPAGPKLFVISGATNITSVVAAGHEGETVILIFTGALTFTDGGNLNLNGNFITSGDDTITITCFGGIWFEVARSPN